MNLRVIRNYFLLSIFCLGCFGYLFLFYNGTQIIEIESLQINYFDPSLNNNVNYHQTIKIVKPVRNQNFDGNSSDSKFPAVIMIHGEIVDSTAMNALKIEFLENNYVVVLLEVEFNYKLFFELNATLDYLLLREDIDQSRIGILGHSHGAHYAYHFGWMRNESIQAVICTNFGPLGKFYVDYYEYFERFIDTNRTWDKFRFLNEYDFTINNNTPRNLLLLTNAYFPQLQTYQYYYYRELVLWEIENNNTFYGDFEDGSARELDIQPSMFMHISGLSDPFVIHKQVEWMNNALNNPKQNNSYELILLRLLVSSTTIILAFVSSMIIGSKLISFLPNIVLSLSLIVFMGTTLVIFFNISNLITMFVSFGITGSIVMAITRKDKYWEVNKNYSDCNFVIKTKFFTKKEEYILKFLFYLVVFLEIAFFVFILNNPDYISFWIIFIIYIMFILPYQFQYYFKQFTKVKREKKMYMELINQDIKEDE